MTTFIIIAILGAFTVGAALGVLVMSLLAISGIGDDPLPEIEPQRMSHVQD